MKIIKNIKKIQNIQFNNRINKEISAIKVRLIGIEGKQIGILNFNEALKKAKELGLDLVEINSNTKPIVCRIIKYDKFIYEKNKIIKEQKKKQKNIQIKEIKFRLNTNQNDYQIKLKNIIRFLKEGHKTKISIRFKGREILHQTTGIKIFDRIKNDLIKFAMVELFSNKIENRQIIMILAPKK